MNPEKDYYAILGVERGADREAIEEAYERRARELQPDVNEPASDPEGMREVDEAFDVLDDPARRAEYDSARRTAHDYEAAAATPREEAGPPPRPAGRDLTLPMALGLMLSGVAVLAAGAFVLISALSDDDGGDGAGGGDFTTTPSGLRFRDDEVGDGGIAEMGKVATVHYTGTLEDGTEFDSSVGDTPFAFTVGATEVIPGWDEGVAGMKAGGSRRLIIPPELAYGETGAGNGIIPPNATLVFDITLLGVHDVPAESPPEVSGDEIELESGLKAIDIVEGDGDEAVDGSTVAVHYTGWLAADGKQFDSSLLSSQGPQGQVSSPRVFNFVIGQGNVIRGWDAGVPGMKEGGKRRLLIPAPLGYADRGSPPSIPPNADLIFDIELVEVLE